MQQFILNTVIQWIHYERRYAFYHSLVYKSGLHRPINMAQGIALLNPCRHTYSVQQHPSHTHRYAVLTPCILILLQLMDLILSFHVLH